MRYHRRLDAATAAQRRAWGPWIESLAFVVLAALAGSSWGLLLLTWEAQNFIGLGVLQAATVVVLPACLFLAWGLAVEYASQWQEMPPGLLTEARLSLAPEGRQLLERWRQEPYPLLMRDWRWLQKYWGPRFS